MKQANMRRPLFAIFVLLMALGISTAALSQQSVGPRGVVGDGTPGSCTQAALTAEILAGGTVTFNCAAGENTIGIIGSIVVNAAVTTVIDGTNGGEEIILSNVGGATANSRILDLTAAANITLQNITLQNGDVTTGPTGGAVRLGITGSTLTATNVQFLNNQTTNNGGAIFLVAGATLTVSQSSFVGNDAGISGGAIGSSGAVTVNVTNSTFSGNTAVTSGGVLRVTVPTAANFTNNTFVGNTAPVGPVLSKNAGGAITLTNNILSGAAVFCDTGNMTDGGGNVLFGGGTCAGITAASTADPLLGALTTDVDGPTQYYPLGTGSSAIDLVACGALTVDQIGTTRPQGTTCDAGSIEAAGAAPTETPTDVPPTETPTDVPPTETPTDLPATETSTPEDTITPGGPTETATETAVPGTETATATEGTPVEGTATSTETPAETATATNTALPVPGAFDLISPANGAIVRDPADVTAITWGESVNADTYQFILFQLSNNVRLGVVIDLTGLTGAADTDPLTCAAGVCTLTITATEQALLEDGQYAWTVLATNGFGSTEAANAPYFFSVDTDPLQLIVNGGFEVDADEDKQPDGWTAKNVSKDKIKCNKETKIVAYAGLCAYQFKGVPGESSKLQQKPAVTEIAQGNSLTLSLYANTKIAAAGKIVNVVLKYVEPDAGTNSDGKDKLSISLAAPTAGETYENFTASLTVDGTPSKLKVQLMNKSTSGKLFFDEVTLVVGAGGGGLIPLP
jgi:predicted outer membrane repeat protein